VDNRGEVIYYCTVTTDSVVVAVLRINVCQCYVGRELVWGSANIIAVILLFIYLMLLF